MSLGRLNIPLSRFGPSIAWSDEDLKLLAQKAVSVAADCGLRITHSKALRILEGAGARVDRSNGRVRFSESQIADTIEKLKTENPLKPNEIPETLPYYIGDGAHTLYNRKTKKTETATPEVFAGIIRMADGLDRVGSVTTPVQLSGSSQFMGNMEAFALILTNTGKPSSPYILAYPQEASFLYEMVKIVEKAKGTKIGLNDQEYVTPPFKWDDISLDRLWARADAGFKQFGIGTMSIAGYSAPVTMAGLIVSAAAEILAASTSVRMLFPHARLYNICGSGRMDMANGNVTFCAPRVILQQLAVIELFRRGLGYSIHGLTCYRDANEPGLQAAFEFAMVHCFWRFLDRASAFGLGHLGNGSVFSATQAPLDMAASLEFEEFTRPFEISEETIGLDAIQAASEGALLMDHSSTLEHFREEIRGSQFFPRGLTAGAGHEEFQTERLLNEADNIVREAFNRSEFRVDAHLQKELQEHLDRAARELGAGSAMRIDKVKPAWPW